MANYSKSRSHLKKINQIKKVKILFVTTKLINGGAQIQLLNFIKKFPDNIEASVVTIKNEGTLANEFRRNNISVYSLDYRSKVSIFSFIKMLKLIKKNSVDIVYTLGFGDSLFWGRLAAVIMNVKVIYSSLHTLPDLGGKIDIFNRFMNKFNTRFLPVTKKISNELIYKYKIPKEKVSLLSNGIEFEKIKKIEKKLFSKKNTELVKKNDGRIVLIQVGKLIYYKNQISTLKLAEKLILKDQINNICFVIVGSGPDEDKIRDFVKDKELNNNVFLTGSVSHNECLFLISKSDILLLPSLSEAFPNILVEGSMFCKPIVAADVGGVDEIVINKKSGLLYDKGDESKYIQCVRQLIDSENLRKSFGEKGFQHVVDNFTMDKKITRFQYLIAKDLKK